MSNFKNKKLAKELSEKMKHCKFHYEPQILENNEWKCLFFNDDGSNLQYHTKEEAENSITQLKFNDNSTYRIRPYFHE